MSKRKNKDESKQKPSKRWEDSTVVVDETLLIDVDAEIPESLPAPKPEAPKEAKPLVALSVFSAIFGPKWDQLAGFKYYAKKNKLGPLTVLEWRQAFADFMNRPTR